MSPGANRHSDPGASAPTAPTNRAPNSTGRIAEQVPGRRCQHSGRAGTPLLVAKARRSTAGSGEVPTFHQPRPGLFSNLNRNSPASSPRLSTANLQAAVCCYCLPSASGSSSPNSSAPPASSPPLTLSTRPASTYRPLFISIPAPCALSLAGDSSITGGIDGQPSPLDADTARPADNWSPRRNSTSHPGSAPWADCHRTTSTPLPLCCPRPAP